MYSYVSSVAKRRQSGAYWEDVSLGNTTFETIMKTYSGVAFTLQNPALGGTVYATLNNMLDYGVRQDLTVNEWFALLGERYFDVVYEPYRIESDSVRYRDGIRSGFSWEHIASGVNPGVDLPLSERPDLLLHKEGIDKYYFTENALVTVNGLFHRVRYNSGEILIEDAGRTIVKSDRNSIGVINADKIGPIEQKPITASMIAEPENGHRLYDSAFIDVGQSLEGKSIMLSLGGYLHVGDDVCKVINDQEGIVRIDFSKINLLERLFDQRHIMSLASLPLSTTQINTGAITVGDLTNDDVLKAYLQLPQTFLIICDAASLYKKTRNLEDAGFDNVYYSYTEPKFPIQMRHGLFPEVWVREEDGVWVLTVHEGLVGRRMLYSGPWQADGRVDPGYTPESAYHNATAIEVEIGTDKLVWG